MPAAIEWTAELEAEIVRLLASNSLRKICQINQDLPCRDSITDHMAENEEFSAKCARARKLHALNRLETAQDKLHESDGSTLTAIELKLIEAQVGDVHWLAERLLSKDYAPNQRFTGADGEGPVEIIKRVITDV
jgi:hypothetical protein